MKVSNISILFQEVPDEISLGINFTGCPLKCPDCHSKENWDKEFGEEFNSEILTFLLDKYRGMISCVCFMGGDWYWPELFEYQDLARKFGLKTCLYTGLNLNTEHKILRNFDYIKLGPYEKNLGGLESKTTNQRFYKRVRDDWEDITYKFWR